ncbi:MAG: hypothetical protein HYY42_07335 [Chloroflexi bacterium]|nr:hypothetical protein [Chloroflexota bacterium]
MSYVETFTRRELFRRLGRVALATPIMLATRDQQGELVYRLSVLFGGKSSIVGRWLRDLSRRWFW